MRKYVFLVLMVLLLIPNIAAAEEYTVAAGDVLNISIMCSGEIPGSLTNSLGYSSLNLPNEIVRPDGMMAIPLLGEMKAEGLTVGALTQQITEQLSQYFVEPHVTINLAQIRITEVCVLGEVNKPGVYGLGKNHTLLEAIGAASGWTRDAAKTKVFIIRKNQKGEPIKVNLVELLKRGDASMNCMLNEGDIVYLSKNNRIDVAQDVLPVVWPAYLIHHWERVP